MGFDLMQYCVSILVIFRRSLLLIEIFSEHFPHEWSARNEDFADEWIRERRSIFLRLTVAWKIIQPVFQMFLFALVVMVGALTFHSHDPIATWSDYDVVQSFVIVLQLAIPVVACFYWCAEVREAMERLNWHRLGEFGSMSVANNNRQAL